MSTLTLEFKSCVDRRAERVIDEQVVKILSSFREGVKEYPDSEHFLYALARFEEEAEKRGLL